MPPKKRSPAKRKRKQHGKGAVADLAAKLVQLGKDTQVISKGLNILAPNSGIAQTISGAASQLGYGRVHAMHGGGLGEILGSIGGALGTGVNRTLGSLFGGSRSTMAVR